MQGGTCHLAPAFLPGSLANSPLLGPLAPVRLSHLQFPWMSGPVTSVPLPVLLPQLGLHPALFLVWLVILHSVGLSLGAITTRHGLS
jgi:hypothetical protein